MLDIATRMEEKQRTYLQREVGSLNLASGARPRSKLVNAGLARKSPLRGYPEGPS